MDNEKLEKLNEMSKSIESSKKLLLYIKNTAKIELVNGTNNKITIWEKNKKYIGRFIEYSKISDSNIEKISNLSSIYISMVENIISKDIEEKQVEYRNM